MPITSNVLKDLAYPDFINEVFQSSSIGSIEPVKRANFTILDRNPLETSPEEWPQIGIWGVVIDGLKKPL